MLPPSETAAAIFTLEPTQAALTPNALCDDYSFDLTTLDVTIPDGTPHKRALAIVEKALGPNHRDVAVSLSNLAECYRAQGRYAEAEPRYTRALAIQEKALGPDHPDVATSVTGLAALYRATDRIPAAEALEKRATHIRYINNP